MSASKSFAREKLAAAKDSLAAEDAQAATLALVELWSKLPSTRVAAIVEHLSTKLPREELPKKVGDREALWVLIAEKKDLTTVPTLLSVEWPAHPGGVKLRLDHLVTFPPDPRIAKALRELWIGGRYRSRAGQVFWRRAFRLLLNWKDPETARVIGSAKVTDDGYFIVEPILQRRTKTPLPTEPELTPEIIASLEEIEHLAGVTRASPDADKLRAQLFEDVYANPHSDEPRLVLGDLLAQEGDPRGELIQLMSAVEAGRGNPKIEKRIARLLRDNMNKWLDGIGGVVDTPVFRSGFVSDVELQGKINPEITGWRTVESIHLAGVPFDVGVLSHPNLSGVHKLANLPCEQLIELARLDRELDELTIIGIPAPIRSATLKVKHLTIAPDDEIEVDFDGAVDWFDASALSGTTRLELGLNVTEATMPKALRRLLSPDRARLSELRFAPRATSFYLGVRHPSVGWEVTLRRDEEAIAVEATFHARYADGPLRVLGPALSALPPDSLSSVIVRAAQSLAPTLLGPITSEVHQALKRQSRLSTKEILGATG